jgi:alkyldihydroxyacetonephosphate synthase
VRSHWGWGFEADRPSPQERRAAAAALADHLGFGSPEPEEPVPLAAVRLPEPRVQVPSALAALCSQDTGDRIRHAHGRSYLDLVRGLRGRFPHPPDAVAHPRDEAELARVLDWCAGERLAVVPYGGGTSVVGGVDAIPGPGQAGAVSVDLGRMDHALEVDPVSRAARIQAGASGPRLEEQLGELTLRFYPQSFELSTLGGWIATRAAGHFATGATHVDDLVESIRALTIGGAVWESRRLPASGAGPSPDRLLLGSEGTLAVVVDAWVRVQPRPAERAGASVRFAEFAAGCAAVRDVVQEGLAPANCRLVEAREAALTLAGDAHLLVLGFEGGLSRERLDRALSFCARHGGEAQARRNASDAWRDAFLRAPYLRDTLVAMGVVCETFESAMTWDRLDRFVAEVKAATADALREACGDGIVTCRLTHAYPDGAAPYFTVLAPARRGEEEAAWGAVKRAAAEAVLAQGGTITHHHAIGRDHRPYYDRQSPDPFAAALSAAKRALDPAGLLNPGVLVPHSVQ